MKKLLLLLAVLVLLAGSVSAEGMFSFYGGGGVNMPLSPTLFKDYWKMGFNFSGGIGYMAQPNVEVIARFTYNTFPFDEDNYLQDIGVSSDDATIDGFDFRAIQVEADIKYIFGIAAEEPPPFLPFGIVGVGITNLKFTDVTVTSEGESVTLPFSDYSETKLSLSGGLGFDYMFSPQVGLFLEGRVAVILTSGDSFTYLPFKAGIKFNFGH